MYYTCKLFSLQRGKETQGFLKETGIQAQILVQLLFSIMKPHKNCQKQVKHEIDGFHMIANLVSSFFFFSPW